MRPPLQVRLRAGRRARLGAHLGSAGDAGADRLDIRDRSRGEKLARIGVPWRTEQLIDAGVKSILCYAPITLNVPKHIRVEYIDPVISFQHMTFYLDQGCIEE